MVCCLQGLSWILYLGYVGALYYFIFEKSGMDVKNNHFDQVILGMISLLVFGRFINMMSNTCGYVHQKNKDNEDEIYKNYNDYNDLNPPPLL